MASATCFKAALALPESIDLRQAGRYYGLRGPDAAADALLARLAPGLLAAAAPRCVWREFRRDENPELFAGSDIEAHLEGCSGYVLLGVTLGEGVDRAVRRAGIGDVAAASAADALASALAEQAADAAQRLLEGKTAEKGMYLTSRYSPGYGDWPLAAQRGISALLDLPKNLGVTVTDHFLMLPRKSITAVLGTADHAVKGKLAGCATCALQGRCAFRKRGTTCGREDDFSK